MLTDQETATILFALRYYQQEFEAHGEDDVVDPEGFFNDHEPLSPDEIDSLCERLNSPRPEPAGPIAELLKAAYEERKELQRSMRGAPDWATKLVNDDGWMERYEWATQRDSEQRACCRTALTTLMEIIELTYAHDEAGSRIDEEGDHSASDIVDMLCGIENCVKTALESLG